jgi:hypothetical protein
MGTMLPQHKPLLHLLGLSRYQQACKDWLQVCSRVLDRTNPVLHDELCAAICQQGDVRLDATERPRGTFLRPRIDAGSIR